MNSRLRQCALLLCTAAVISIGRERAQAVPPYQIDTFPTVDDSPLVIAGGPAGSNVLWVTVDDEPKLLKVTLAAKPGTPPAIRPVQLPEALGDPRQLVLGPDGNMWLTASRGVARLTPAGAFSVSKYETPDAFGIAPGPDGKMWFSFAKRDTASGAGRSIGRLSLDLTQFDSLDISQHELQLVSLAKGTDGNVWGITACLFEGTCSIARIAPGGDVKLYPSPQGSKPFAMTPGPDGALWYGDYGKDAIGRVTPSSGEVKEYALEAQSQPTFIVVGPDRALWFVESGACKIGRITVDGKIDTIAVPTKNCELFGLTVGPDGNIWFTLTKPGAIGRVTLR